MSSQWVKVSEDHWIRRDGVEIASKVDAGGRTWWFVDAVPDPKMVTAEGPAIAGSRESLMSWIDRSWPLRGGEDRGRMELAVVSVAMAIVTLALVVYLSAG